MHFEFFEGKRLKLIERVKAIKEKKSKELSKSAMDLDKRSFSATPSQLSHLPTSFQTQNSPFALSNAQTKHMRLIENIVKNEEIMNKKYEDYQKIFLQREQKLQEDQKRFKELDKLKKQKQKQKENKKFLVLERAEQQMQKTSQELIFKAFEAEQRVQERQKFKKQQLEQKKQENEKKLNSKIFRAQKNILDLEKLKQYKFQEKQQKEKVIMSRIEIIKNEKLQQSQQKRTLSEQKKFQVLNQNTKQKEEKRDVYIQHQINLEEKYNYIMQQKMKQTYVLRSLSQNRDEKIALTREKEKAQLEIRKKILIEKQNKAMERVQKQRDLSERSLFLQQEQRKLLSINKQINRQRQAKREEYLVQKKLTKAKEVNQKISFYQSAKNRLMSERLRLSTENTLQRIQIKETLRNMAITNKFDIKKVRNLFTSGAKSPSNTSTYYRSVNSTPVGKNHKKGYSFMEESQKNL